MVLRVLSLGAGVQSTTLALMAARGEIAPPDLAVFADTGAEPGPVYDHLQWLTSPNVALPFPVKIVTAGSLRMNLREGTNTTGHRFVGVPFFGRTEGGRSMMARRQCTEEYKLKPIRKFIRDTIGSARPRKGSCVMLIGISRDEVERIKPSRVNYIVNEYPLVDIGMRRWECIKWLERNGYPLPPKSACAECPFRSDREWRWLRDCAPDDWEEACKTDEMIRKYPGRFRSELFLHRSLTPLRTADISSAEDRGQIDWVGECEGICGN